MLLVACSAPGRDHDDSDGPGKGAWQEEDLGCASDADCGPGEHCDAGSCRLERCGEPFHSAPPLGDTHFFRLDGELAVTSDERYLDAFAGEQGDYLGSWDAGSTAIADVVDGNFDGKRPRAIAVARVGHSEVELLDRGKLAVGFAPRALAAGDVDGDGLDELLALSASGALALCNVELGSCHTAAYAGSGVDLSAGDVDGDGFVEPVMLLEQGGDRSIVVHHEDGGPPATHALPFLVEAIAAGDLDGDGTAEIAALEDRGWLGFASDRLHLVSGIGGTVDATLVVSESSIDVGAGDVDGDGRAELVLLRGDHQLELMRHGPGGLTTVMLADVTVGQEPSRVAVLDLDGDSAAGELVDGPALVAGEVVPTLAVAFPPYPEGVAAGVPGLWVGDSKDVTTEASNTVALELGVMVGLGFESPLLEASVGASLAVRMDATHTLTRSLSVAEYFYLDADPERHRDIGGAVVVSCGCYHRYRYRTYDPRGSVGGSDQTIDVLVPVGGQTQMWSPGRYNAMAAATGTMPIIDFPYRLGDIGSYPSSATALDGAPIQPADLLFVDVPSYQASEVAEVEFWLIAGEYETNAAVESTELGVEASFGAGLELELSAAAGLAQGYSIEVGNEALFVGWVPAIPDHPDTPEDEFATYGYGFVPQIYRQRYVDRAGREAGYYALTYTVAP